ncbi:MAG: hypothetical protein M0Z56_03135, partial [Desulfobacteraceae bacterium]|nr:hypothetical protein [Desulfobacteraceae bacterium]
MIQPEVISLTEAWEMVEHQSAVLVTVNQRLARYLKSQYNDRQSHSGKRAWETPLILPYDSWTENSYNEAAVSRQASGRTGIKILMSKDQECLVWEQIIRKWDHDQGRRLLLVPETARIAVKAWELCREWRIPRHELGQTPSDDTAAFLDWVENFERLCREKGWQDRAGIDDVVMDLMKSSQITAPKQIILAGFDEMPPRKSDMIQAMAASGSGVAMLSNSLETSVPRRYAAIDAEAEMAAAARWARACLEENPNSRIGILAPDLEARRPDLIRQLDDVFHPSRVLIPDDSGSRIFNISKGRPLSEYPVARAAFLILNFSYRPLLAAETTDLLISPFIGGADSEFSGRALLDARIRENGEISMTICGLIHCLKRQANRVHDNRHFCKALYQFVQKFQKEADRQNDIRRSSEWAGIFNSLLLSMGWPGDRTLTSEEYQTVEAFKKALSQFAAMDMVASQMDVRTAVAEFT